MNISYLTPSEYPHNNSNRNEPENFTFISQVVNNPFSSVPQHGDQIQTSYAQPELGSYGFATNHDGYIPESRQNMHPRHDTSSTVVYHSPIPQHQSSEFQLKSSSESLSFGLDQVDTGRQTSVYRVDTPKSVGYSLERLPVLALEEICNWLLLSLPCIQSYFRERMPGHPAPRSTCQWRDAVAFALTCRRFHATMMGPIYRINRMYDGCSALRLSAKRSSMAGVLYALTHGLQIPVRGQEALEMFPIGSPRLRNPYCHDLSPLMWACLNGHQGIYQALVEAGADINETISAQEIIDHAEDMNVRRMIRELVYEDHSMSGSAGSEFDKLSALYLSLHARHTNISINLIKSGANLVLNPGTGIHVIHKAARLNLVRVLKHVYTHTPFVYLVHDIKLNGVLHYALSQPTSTMDYLISHLVMRGANTQGINYHGHSPLDTSFFALQHYASETPSNGIFGDIQRSWQRSVLKIVQWGGRFRVVPPAIIQTMVFPDIWQQIQHAFMNRVDGQFNFPGQHLPSVREIFDAGQTQQRRESRKAAFQEFRKAVNKRQRVPSATQPQSGEVKDGVVIKTELVTNDSVRPLCKKRRL